MATSLDDDIRDLYAGDFASFVKRRDELAKQLRAEDRRDDAATVKALRKPEKLAGELDHAAAANTKAVAALLDAAKAAGDAQAKGGDMRAATAGLRDAVRTLAAATSDPAAATSALVAVVADPDALDALAGGRLVSVPEGGGFGPLPTGPVPARPSKPEDDSKRREAEAEVEEAEAGYEEAAAAMAAATRARKDAESAEREAEQRVKAAQRDVDAARKALAKLR
jgi:hypothetical protein